MAEERLTSALDEADAERRIATITGEIGPLPPVAEHPSLLRRGVAVVHDLGKIALNGNVSELLAETLRRAL